MPPLAPPVTPKVPPQLVACSVRTFYRISQSALDVFEIALDLPPPQIRGSRVSRKIAEVGIEEPLNVLSPGKMSALVIATGGVFRYELGKTGAERYAPIPAKSPLVAWPDRGRSQSFHVHSAGEAQVREYTLARIASGHAASPEVAAKVSEKIATLPELDGRLFTVLADGTALYSTPKGLIRNQDASPPAPFPSLSGPATLVFADGSAERYWAADASGKLALFDRTAGAPPIATPAVPGVVIDTATDGERVAVLSMTAVDQSYQPTVTIFSNGKEQGRLQIGPSIGTRAQPKLDLCLVAGLPWVVVGSTRWLQLLDWESRRLLAEW